MVLKSFALPVSLAVALLAGGPQASAADESNQHGQSGQHHPQQSQSQSGRQQGQQMQQHQGQQIQQHQGQQIQQHQGQQIQPYQGHQVQPYQGHQVQPYQGHQVQPYQGHQAQQQGQSPHGGQPPPGGGGGYGGGGRPEHGGGGFRPEHHAFHERDIHRFRDEDLTLWRGGHWHQGWHDGRYGWWWFAGGAWYWYAEPVYPNPLYVSEVVAVEAMPPPAVIVQPPPPVPMVSAPQPNVWYYCDNPAGYYPYVQTCAVPFRAVPAGN